MIVILPKRVSLLADQLSKILLIFSIFSLKLELRDLSSKVENYIPKAKTFSFAQVIGLLEGNVRLESLEAPIQRASVFSQLTFKPDIEAKASSKCRDLKKGGLEANQNHSCVICILG